MPADLAVVLDTNVWISGIFFRRASRLASWPPGVITALKSWSLPTRWLNWKPTNIITYPSAFVKSTLRGANASKSGLTWFLVFLA